MRFIKRQCPCCGGWLTIEDDLQTFRCDFCHTELILDGQSKAIVNAKVKLREIESKERLQQNKLDSEERIRQNELEAHSKIRKSELKTKRTIAISIAVILIIAGISAFALYKSAESKHNERVLRLMELETEIENDIINQKYDDALIKTNQLSLDDNWPFGNNEHYDWNRKRYAYQELIAEKKREEEISRESTVFAPQNSDDFSKFTKDEAISIFQNSGFTNVECVEVSGKAGFFKKKHLVEHIIINGNSYFTTDDYFNKDDKVIIYYYAK